MPLSIVLSALVQQISKSPPKKALVQQIILIAQSYQSGMQAS